MSLPVPNPSFFGEDMERVDTAFMGYRMLPGEPLRDHLDALKAVPACRHLASQLATWLRELHGFPAQAVGLELPVQDLDRREALPGIYEQVRQHLYPHVRPDARALIAERFEAFLDQASSSGYTRAIKHGDLGVGNILVDPETLRISGILDFGSAGLDDPAVDLGFVSFWGESLLGSKAFVEQVYDTYPVDEPLLRRIQFYRLMIPLWMALGALHGDDRETFELVLAPYV